MDLPERLFPFRDRQQAPVLGFCFACGCFFFVNDSIIFFFFQKRGSTRSSTGLRESVRPRLRCPRQNPCWLTWTTEYPGWPLNTGRPRLSAKPTRR